MEWAGTLPLKSDEDPDGDNEDGDNGQRVRSKDKGGHNDAPNTGAPTICR